MVVGPAGTGKTAMLAAAQEALAAQGRELVVLAPTRKAAQVAAEELGARPPRWPSCCTTTAGAGTTSGAIARPCRRPRPPLVPRASPVPPLGGPTRGRGTVPALSAGSVVVVDEAGLLSVDQAVALIDVVRGLGPACAWWATPASWGRWAGAG